MADKISFEYEDEYDSEEEYNDEEKQMLDTVRKRSAKYSESEEEIFPLQSNSSSDSDVSNEIADSDINDEEGLPNERAWGKKKRMYYSTDYVDKDYGGFNEKDADAAQFEEEEARNIKKRLMEQFDDEDFSLDILRSNKEKVDESSHIEDDDVIKADLSTMSKRQKRDLLTKESPEFLELTNEFRSKMTEIIETIGPVLDLSKKETMDENLIQFLQTQYEVVWNYLIHINFYLLLKSVRANVKYHPVVKRLVQYKEMFSQLEPTYQNILPKIKEVLRKIQKVKSVTLTSTKKSKNKKDKPKKTLKILNNLNKKDEIISEKEDERIQQKTLNKTKKSKKTKEFSEPCPQKIDKKVTFDETKYLNEYNDNAIFDQSSEKSIKVEKRPITYQIAKNKGLTPRRKKEQRNPRVKNRNKYRQAKIRRKGAVREIKKELTRYGGEVSGIKASVTKSIKIK